MAKTLTELQNDYNVNRTQLAQAIAAKDQKLITLYRGRLITTISKITSDKYASLLTPGQLNTYKTELSTELATHKNQIDYRMQNEKKNAKDYSISKEIGLKLKKVATSIKAIKHANTADEKKAAILSTAGNTLSTIFSFSKIALKPASFVVKKAGGAAAYLTGYAVGLPADILKNLFGTIVNPDKKYDVALSKKFGGFLQKNMENAIGELNDRIMRL